MQKPQISQKKLKNGLVILVHENHQLPEVAVHIVYGTGSKNDPEHKRGLAHAVEHMIFKGNSNLSETDFMRSIFKISGSTNAFTAKDYTEFLCNIPSTQIAELFQLMSEFMSSPRFDNEVLKSEICALIQEASIAEDNYDQILREELTAAIFHEHEYHNPTRGNKFDIGTFTSADLHNFFNSYYRSDNCVVVVVGDVTFDSIEKLSENYLAHINAHSELKSQPKKEYVPDTSNCSTLLYRDISTSRIKLAFVVPGIKSTLSIAIELLCIILAREKSSRLYQRLVIERDLVEYINAATSYFFNPDLFYIVFKPKEQNSIDSIICLILEEIKVIANRGLAITEIEQAITLYTQYLYNLLENKSDFAQFLGQTYLATRDISYINTIFQLTPESAQALIKQLLTDYLQDFRVNTGFLLPFDKETRIWWRSFQAFNDKFDIQAISEHKRLSSLQEPLFINNIRIRSLPHFICPVPKVMILNNKFKAYYYNTASQNITILIKLSLDYQYDRAQNEGIHNFLQYALCQENRYEQLGIVFNYHPMGMQINLPASQLKIALKALRDILTKNTLDARLIARLKHHLQYKINESARDPEEIAQRLVMQYLYRDQPFTKPILGKFDSVKNITEEKLETIYNQFISPEHTEISIVGNITGYDIEQLLHIYFGAWESNNTILPEIIYPPLEPITENAIDYYLDQSLITLHIAGRSLAANNPLLDHLAIFDQFFTGNYERNNISQLFQIRDRTGAFYTFDGSLLDPVGGNNNMLSIKTKTLNSTVHEAEMHLKQAIYKAPEDFEQDTFEQARKVLLFSFIGQFETAESLARTFLSYGSNLHPDFFQERANYIEQIKLQDVQEAVIKTLREISLVTIRVGRTQVL